MRGVEEEATTCWFLTCGLGRLMVPCAKVRNKENVASLWGDDVSGQLNLWDIPVEIELECRKKNFLEIDLQRSVCCGG